MTRLASEFEALGVGTLYTVVNASDPKRHEVAVFSTKERADNAVIAWNREYGWEYEVVVQTAGVQANGGNRG